MANQANTVTRRETLVGIATAGALATIPAVPALAVVASRRDWDAAMANLTAAHAASDAMEAKVERIDRAFNRLCDKVPHAVMPTSGGWKSTADDREIRWTRSSQASVRHVETCAYADQRADFAYLTAADARQAKIKTIGDRLGRDAAHDRYDALTNEICAAEQALLDMPAPDGEALMWKINRLYSPADSLWEPSFVAQTHADLSRFLIGAGS